MLLSCAAFERPTNTLDSAQEHTAQRHTLLEPENLLSSTTIINYAEQWRCIHIPSPTPIKGEPKEQVDRGHTRILRTHSIPIGYYNETRLARAAHKPREVGREVGKEEKKAKTKGLDKLRVIKKQTKKSRQCRYSQCRIRPIENHRPSR